MSPYDRKATPIALLLRELEYVDINKLMPRLCDICDAGRVPRKNNVMNFLYLGPGSCMQYWIAGRRGQIPDHMCDIVRYLARSVCSCDVIPPNAALQNLALALVGNKTVEGREPIRIPKGPNQLYSESMFLAYENGLNRVLN